MTSHKVGKSRRTAKSTGEWVGAADVLDGMREERARRNAPAGERLASDVLEATRKDRKRPGAE